MAIGSNAVVDFVRTVLWEGRGRLQGIIVGWVKDSEGLHLLEVFMKTLPEPLRKSIQKRSERLIISAIPGSTRPR